MNFLEKLQSAPERTKRRWIIAATAVLMVVVIYIWLVYFNNLITAFSRPISDIGQPNSAASSGSTSFWQTIKGSVANLYEIFTDKLHALGDILNAPREYIIKPPQ